jgi:hypothetical protein
MAIEDAACLATLFGYARTIGNIGEIADVYEKVRRPRVDQMHEFVLSMLPGSRYTTERSRSPATKDYEVVHIWGRTNGLLGQKENWDIELQIGELRREIRWSKITMLWKRSVNNLHFPFCSTLDLILTHLRYLGAKRAANVSNNALDPFWTNYFIKPMPSINSTFQNPKAAHGWSSMSITRHHVGVEYLYQELCVAAAS